MINVRPFRAIRPQASAVKDFSCPPYDVMSRAEARTLAAKNKNQFLHVTRSDIDFDDTIDSHSQQVYSRAAENLDRLVQMGTLSEDPDPTIYLYRLEMQGHVQTGITAMFSVADYEKGLIKIHEKTRPDKEDDRLNHILETSSHAEPVLLTYRENRDLTKLVDASCKQTPAYDFASEDGVRHRLWTVVDPLPLLNLLSQVPAVYIADGHHRAASASRAHKESDCPTSKNSDAVTGTAFFPGVLFPDSQLQILPYNRIVRKSGLAVDSLLAQLKQEFVIQDSAAPAPTKSGEISMYVQGKWFGLRPKQPVPGSDPISRLDVSVLFNKVLKPLFKIENERTDYNIDFVGGIRGTQELEKLVNSGAAFCAFSMFPVSVQAVLDVADQGMIMAPKSTWFEPKLRSGLFIHRF